MKGSQEKVRALMESSLGSAAFLRVGLLFECNAVLHLLVGTTVVVVL